MADKYVNATGLSRFLTKLKAYIAAAISGISASNISTGVLAIANGGSGASGTVDQWNVASAPNRVSINTSNVRLWGKVGMLSAGFTVTAALSAGTEYKICELSAGVRPSTYAACQITRGFTATCTLYPDGSVMVRPIGSNIPVNSLFSLMGTYLVE